MSAKSRPPSLRFALPLALASVLIFGLLEAEYLYLMLCATRPEVAEAPLVRYIMLLSAAFVYTMIFFALIGILKLIHLIALRLGICPRETFKELLSRVLFWVPLPMAVLSLIILLMTHGFLRCAPFMLAALEWSFNVMMLLFSLYMVSLLCKGCGRRRRLLLVLVAVLLWCAYCAVLACLGHASTSYG